MHLVGGKKRLAPHMTLTRESRKEPLGRHVVYSLTVTGCRSTHGCLHRVLTTKYISNCVMLYIREYWMQHLDKNILNFGHINCNLDTYIAIIDVYIVI